jgi:hypothetical protein
MRIDAGKKVAREYRIENRTTGETYLFKFSRFVDRNGIQMPLFIQLVRLPEHERISIFYEDAWVNIHLQAKEFALKVPPSVLVIRM